MKKEKLGFLKLVKFIIPKNIKIIPNQTVIYPQDLFPCSKCPFSIFQISILDQDIKQKTPVMNNLSHLGKL
ncbi:hypothetical protein EF405_16725 [Cyclobacteriaceae bacterium YHN15]|nr:hypothetical protein EF405_16725 [Cyclobacteriaceae bacterium YHN15]